MKPNYNYIESLLKESSEEKSDDFVLHEFHKIKKTKNIEMNCSEEDCGGDGKHIFKKI